MSTVPEESKDLGFGARVAQQSRLRLLNPDGSFNARRSGQPLLRSLSSYHLLLSLPWPRFYALVVVGYLLTNLAFAYGYWLCGGLDGIAATDGAGRFAECFFFSVQTLATIGYGKIAPVGTAAHLLVTLEALVGMLGFAVATGILFARFSRPTADILFSHRAIVAPYRDGKAFQFRIVNARSNHLTEVEAVVVVTLGNPGMKGRSFHELKLERAKVMFLPLHWVVNHAIDESSPLYGMDAAALAAQDAEFLVLIKGVDETFSQTVHVRTSYKHDEILWGVKFRDMFLPPSGDVVEIDVRRLHDVEPAA